MNIIFTLLPLSPSSPEADDTTAPLNSEAATLSVAVFELAVACLTHKYEPLGTVGTAVVQLLRVPPVTAPVANV